MRIASHHRQKYGVVSETRHWARHMSAALRAFLDFATTTAGEQPNRTHSLGEGDGTLLRIFLTHPNLRATEH
jgi:hypothetical protein